MRQFSEFFSIGIITLTIYISNFCVGEATTTDNGDADGTLGRNNSISLESDSSLARVLDLLIIYLRVVHSLDYYAGAIYLLEDQMPHRCGIFHARGDRGLNSSTANGRISNLTFTQREVNEHLQVSVEVFWYERRN